MLEDLLSRVVTLRGRAASRCQHAVRHEGEPCAKHMPYGGQLQALQHLSTDLCLRHYYDMEVRLV